MEAEATAAPAVTPPLLEFDHVHTYYGQIHILDDVCVEEGVFAAQGYFLARPAVEPGAASPEFAEWLAARGARLAPALEERGGEPAKVERGAPKERFEL